ncbi:MAG: P-II family nitrogen regulator [Acidobacteria bacterium]|nr:MAG: P-II family nitrogen regulator [Acidobacteriota bacterium]REK02865.1 MAG: P-II family nitrogen regulator [Acidobacteriota bacterium]REK13331.1 MAG: P-II family nitrogen regulator [Acidobacteriota bacterium]REK41325.1 MAG: P-II family nitrogen regulator [Acidobacteriota bacterium]
MKFKLIMAMVKPQVTEQLVDAMKEEGATGATITPARGTGVNEGKTFFGLTVEERTDIVTFLVEEHAVPRLLGTIETRCQFGEPGTGIAFVIPIEQAIGLESQMSVFKDQAREEYL